MLTTPRSTDVNFIASQAIARQQAQESLNAGADGENASDIDPEKADAEELREDFTVDEILDADGDPQHRSVVRLRLQTEKSEAGYWRDTGALAVP